MQVGDLSKCRVVWDSCYLAEAAVDECGRAWRRRSVCAWLDKAIFMTTPQKVKTTAFRRKKTTAKEPVVNAQASDSALWCSRIRVSSARICPVMSSIVSIVPFCLLTVTKDLAKGNPFVRRISTAWSISSDRCSTC